MLTTARGPHVSGRRPRLELRSARVWQSRPADSAAGCPCGPHFGRRTLRSEQWRTVRSRRTGLPATDNASAGLRCGVLHHYRWPAPIDDVRRPGDPGGTGGRFGSRQRVLVRPGESSPSSSSADPQRHQFVSRECAGAEGPSTRGTDIMRKVSVIMRYGRHLYLVRNSRESGCASIHGSSRVPNCGN